MLSVKQELVISSQLLIVGTARLARYLAEAHSVVRPFSRISIWGRDRQKAEQLLADIPAAVKQRCELDSADDQAVQSNFRDAH